VYLELVLVAGGELVVVGQGRVGGDVPQGHDADARVAAHVPLLQLAVGVAAVVDEARRVALVPARLEGRGEEQVRGGQAYVGKIEARDKGWEGH
jgi:hypothetical protein